MSEQRTSVICDVCGTPMTEIRSGTFEHTGDCTSNRPSNPRLGSWNFEHWNGLSDGQRIKLACDMQAEIARLTGELEKSEQKMDDWYRTEAKWNERVMRLLRDLAVSKDGHFEFEAYQILQGHREIERATDETTVTPAVPLGYTCDVCDQWVTYHEKVHDCTGEKR